MTLFEYLKGKKAAFYGDSITYGVYTGENDPCPQSMVSERWCDIVAKSAGIAEYENLSMSGISVSSIPETLPENCLSKNYGRISSDREVIFLSCGTNDFGGNTPIGALGDNTDISFFGALSVLYSGIKERYPSAKVIVVTPINRYDKEKNDIGCTLDGYRTALEAAASAQGFYLLNGDAVGDMSRYMNDSVHPDPDGQKAYGEEMAEQLKKIEL